MDRLSHLESTVSYLTDRIADLESRLASVEAGVVRTRQDLTSSTILPGIGAAPVQQWMALIGRTLVVLGGAYLLRAMTESHAVSPSVGVALGLLYGAPWLWLASRAGERGAHLDSLAHALATALIGYPLVWEATMRFQVLTPPQSAGVLAGLTGAAFVLASRHSLQSLAWVVTLGALGSALGLAIATGSWTAFTLVAIMVGITTLWLGYAFEWVELRWPAALVANFMLFIATGRAGIDGGIGPALWLQAILLAGYLGSFAFRTLLRSHAVVPFEVVQSAGALAVAFGGAVSLLHNSSVGLAVLSVTSGILSLVTYAAALEFSERHRSQTSFFFHALVAFVFGAAALGVGLRGSAAAAAYAGIAIAMVLFARHRHTLTMSLHAILFGMAAAVASGMLGNATLALATPAAALTGRPSVISLVALAALLVAIVLRVTDPRERWASFASIPRCAVAACALWCAAGVIVAFTLSAAGSMEAAMLNTLRTVVLVAATLFVAGAARYAAGREAAWLAYPLLILIGVKLVLVDFPQGRPTTLFGTLGLYGFALILTPRLLRLAAPADTMASAPVSEAGDPRVRDTQPDSAVADRDSDVRVLTGR